MNASNLNNVSDAAARSSLLEIDDVPNRPAPIVVKPAPAPAPFVRGVSINEDDRERAQRDDDAARKAGFAVAPPLYTLGTAVVDAGVENAKASRLAHEQLPSVKAGVSQFIGRILAENRKDVQVDAVDIHMEKSGELAIRAAGALAVRPMTERGFTTLASRLTPGGASYLAACPPEMRAWNLNHWINVASTARVEQNTKRAEKKLDALAPQLNIRTRNAAKGGREIWAVTGSRYTAFDANALAALIGEACPGDAKLRCTYDGYKGSFDVQYHSDINASKYVAGEIFKAGVSLTFADDGSGAISVRSFVLRNRCLNLIILHKAEQIVLSQRHIGNRDRMVAKIKAGIATAMGHIDHFVATWSAASVETVLDAYGTQDVKAIFTALVDKKLVDATHCTDSELVERLTRAFSIEPSYTRHGVINAITRAAHTESWASPWITRELEEQAGQLLYAKQLDFSDTVANA